MTGRYLVRVWDREDDSPSEDYICRRASQAIELYNQVIRSVDPAWYYVTLTDLWAPDNDNYAILN